VTERDREGKTDRGRQRQKQRETEVGSGVSFCVEQYEDEGIMVEIGVKSELFRFPTCFVSPTSAK
jgi:hypothetical protein